MPYSNTNVTIHWVPTNVPGLLSNRFLALDEALSDAALPLQAMGQRMAMHMAERFESQSSPDGVPWTEWSESYAPFAEAHNAGILQQGGTLEATASSPDSFLVMDNDVFVNTANWPYYWHWMNEGAPRKPTPARPFVGMSADEEVEYSEIWFVWINQLSTAAMSTSGTMFMRHSYRGAGGRWAPRSDFVL